MPNDAIADVADYHNDVMASLSQYFSEASATFKERFLGYSPDEVRGKLKERIDETDLRSALAILIRLEAIFRVDYEFRCRKRMKDSLSRVCRTIHKSRKQRVRLDEDILEAWRQNLTGASLLIGALRGAFKYRHWLAHGRYWKPKLGARYDFNTIYDIAENVLSTFPFVDSD